jgi:hypothetical protein
LKEREFYKNIDKELNYTKMVNENKKTEDKKRDITCQEDMNKIFDYLENERNLEKLKSYKNKMDFDMNAINKIKERIKQVEIQDDEILRKYKKKNDDM